MSVSLKKSRGAGRLTVRGAASVRDVAEVRELLLSLAEEKRRVSVDLSETRVCDAAFAQLMVSADLAFSTKSLSFQIIDPDSCLASAFPASGGDIRWVRT